MKVQTLEGWTNLQLLQLARSLRPGNIKNAYKCITERDPKNVVEKRPARTKTSQ